MHGTSGRGARRVLAAGALVLLAGACSTEQAASPLAPQVGAELSKVPARQSRNYRAPDPEYVEACLTLASPMKQSIIEVVVDIGNDGTTDRIDKYLIAAGQCIDVWMHGGPTFDAVRVDIARWGHAGVTQLVSVNAGGVIATNPPASGRSARGLLVNGRTGSTVEFTVF